MENVPERSSEPPSQPEAPRCGTCDAEMTEDTRLNAITKWHCLNPMCEDTDYSYAEVIEKLREIVTAQDIRIVALRAQLATVKGDYQSCHISFMTQMDINNDLRAELATVHAQQAAYSDPAPVVRTLAVRPEVKDAIIAWLQCAPQPLDVLDTRCWKDFEATTFEVVQAIGQIRAEYHLADIDGVYHLGDKRP
jgi:hypothetical protein